MNRQPKRSLPQEQPKQRFSLPPVTTTKPHYIDLPNVHKKLFTATTTTSTAGTSSSNFSNAIKRFRASTPSVAAARSVFQRPNLYRLNNIASGENFQRFSVPLARSNVNFGNINDKSSGFASAMLEEKSKQQIGSGILNFARHPQLISKTFKISTPIAPLGKQIVEKPGDSGDKKCPLCDNSKIYRQSYSVNRHLRDVHKLSCLNETKHVYCLACNHFIEDFQTYLKHVGYEHKVDLSNSDMPPGPKKVERFGKIDVHSVKYNFANVEEFKKWKTSTLEVGILCRYERCFSSDFQRTWFFKCNRVQLKSAYSKLETKCGIIKTDNSLVVTFDNPFDARVYPCPSSMRAIFLADGSLEVTVMPLHMGHNLTDQNVLVIDVSNGNPQQIDMSPKSQPDAEGVLRNNRIDINLADEDFNCDLDFTNKENGKQGTPLAIISTNETINGAIGELTCNNDFLGDESESAVSFKSTKSDATISADETDEILSLMYQGKELGERCSYDVANVLTPIVEAVAVEMNEEEIRRALDYGQHPPKHLEMKSTNLAHKSSPWPDAVKDVSVVPLEQGVEVVQTILHSRKEELAQQFYSLLNACMTKDDLDLIKYQIESISMQILPGSFKC